MLKLLLLPRSLGFGPALELFVWAPDLVPFPLFSSLYTMLFASELDCTIEFKKLGLALIVFGLLLLLPSPLLIVNFLLELLANCLCLWFDFLESVANPLSSLTCGTVMFCFSLCILLRLFNEESLWWIDETSILKESGAGPSLWLSFMTLWNLRFPTGGLLLLTWYF